MRQGEALPQFAGAAASACRGTPSAGFRRQEAQGGPFDARQVLVILTLADEDEQPKTYGPMPSVRFVLDLLWAL